MDMDFMTPRLRYPSGITCLGLNNLRFSEAFPSFAIVRKLWSSEVVELGSRGVLESERMAEPSKPPNPMLQLGVIGSPTLPPMPEVWKMSAGSPGMPIFRECIVPPAR